MIADFKEISGESGEVRHEPEPRNVRGAGGAAVSAALRGTVAIGKGVAAYIRKLCGMRSPEEALAEVDAQLSAVRERREPKSKRYEELYAAISEKKRQRESAPPARRKMLDMALKSLLAEYKSIEREVAVLFRKEEMLVTVRGRMNELAVQGLPMPRTEDVDRLADELTDAIDTDEDLADAVVDLEKVGAERRERHQVDLDEALAEFGDPSMEAMPAAAESRVEETERA